MQVPWIYTYAYMRIRVYIIQDLFIRLIYLKVDCASRFRVLNCMLGSITIMNASRLDNIHIYICTSYEQWLLVRMINLHMIKRFLCTYELEPLLYRLGGRLRIHI